MVNWVMYPLGSKFYPWVIAPYVMSPSRYMIWHVLKKEHFHLWDCPSDLWVSINEYRLGYLWKYLSQYPPRRRFQVSLEAVIVSMAERCQVNKIDRNIVIETSSPMINQIVYDLL